MKNTGGRFGLPTPTLSSLYGYGQPFDGGLSSGIMLNSVSSYSAGGLSGYQSAAGTNNPFDPTCPWPLINQMIQQIAQYVDQMQRAQGFGGQAFGAARFAGYGGPMGMFRKK